MNKTFLAGGLVAVGTLGLVAFSQPSAPSQLNPQFKVFDPIEVCIILGQENCRFNVLPTPDNALNADKTRPIEPVSNAEPLVTTATLHEHLNGQQ